MKCMFLLFSFGRLIINIINFKMTYMIKFILICLSCVLLGCTLTHRPNDFYQKAIDYVIPLVDSGYIIGDYIHLYELAMNDSNSVYEISGMDSPFSRPEYPSKIIKEKGKYFMFYGIG